MTNIVSIEQRRRDRLHIESCVTDFVLLVQCQSLFADLLWRMTSDTDILHTPSIIQFMADATPVRGDVL
ncbi:hypothetical protein NEOLEDRAFT_1133461, partial [Neolentinus lepideus HHB14362 ss-1]